MKKTYLTLILLGPLFLIGCHKENEPHKIIQGFPTNVSETVVPAQAVQQDILIKNEILKSAVAILSRMAAIENPTFPELTPIGGSRYTYPISGRKFLPTTVTIQFYSGGSIIDPVANFSSSNTLTHMTLDSAGSSSEFNFSQTLTITLVTAGDMNSDKIVTGTSLFTGSLHSLPFAISAPGSRTTNDGLVNGHITASGTGPNAVPVTISMSFDLEHHVNGRMTWENREGSFQFAPNGEGVLITNTERLFVP